MTKKRKAIREAKNQRSVLLYLIYLFEERGAGFFITEGIIREVHKQTVDGIYPCGGQYRAATDITFITAGTNIPPPALIPNNIKDLVEWVNSNQAKRLSSLQRSGEFGFRLLAIHPFRGGNGRVARALMGLLLLRDGALDLAMFSELLRFIKNQRKLYIDVIQYCITRAVTKPFILFLAYGVLRSSVRQFRSMPKKEKAKLSSLADELLFDLNCSLGMRPLQLKLHFRE